LTSWEAIWPEISAYFGLKEVGPKTAEEQMLTGTTWVMTQKKNWPAWIKDNGLEDGRIEASSLDLMHIAFEWIVFDKQYDPRLLERSAFWRRPQLLRGISLLLIE
jgi:hypothetical protein